MMKRMLDVMVALTLLIAGSLLFLLIYGLIRWKIGTPVLFRQKRPGLYGRPFMLYKFRTMTDERDEHGGSCQIIFD